MNASARDAAKFAQSINAIPAYAYLGDVSESPTGDKRAQTLKIASWIAYQHVERARLPSYNLYAPPQYAKTTRTPPAVMPSSRTHGNK